MNHSQLKRKNISLLVSLLSLVIGMLMLSYAAVPLYNMFCKLTGYGGTPSTESNFTGIVLNREMTVDFNADTSPHLSWEFKSLQKNITLKVGERQLAFFEATNHSNMPVTAVSTFNVTPFKAGAYFVKTQCFCFEEQTLAAGETMRFPVSFYLDPALDEDNNMQEVKNITLSYTFFPVKEH